MNGFSKNARVCFLGDSITHNNDYVSHIAAYYHENLKDRNVNFYNCGVSGGHVSTLLSNFEDDIMAHNPTHAVIMIGINDSGRGYLSWERNSERYEMICNAFEIYKKNLSELCRKLSEKGVEIIMCTPTPYDEYQISETEPLPGGFALLSEYAQYVRAFAREKGYAVCDYHTYISKIAQTEKIINPDRVHPNEYGHYHMAKCFLAFQGFDIGERKPIPTYMNEWREKVGILRNIRATEHMVIKDYSLSTEERIAKAEAFLENPPESEHKNYFIALSKEYIEDKPRQQKLEEAVTYIMETEFKK